MRNSTRTLFGGNDNLESRRKCLEKPSALEIVTIIIFCGQQWNLTCRWETRNVQSTLRCQAPRHITEETSHLKTGHRPHPSLRLLNYDRATGLSMGEKKLSDGHESVMSANLEEDTEVNKSWHPYLKPDLVHHCHVLLTVKSILQAPLSLS